MDILLVEDNPGDIYLIANTLNQSLVPHILHQVTNGEAAVAFLRREENYTRVPRPCLILLDLNLPKKNGFEVLEEIKRDEDLKSIPVIVLTTSKAEVDIIRSYRLHASSYVTKPFELEEFVRAVQLIEEFWFNLVQLPARIQR